MKGTKNESKKNFITKHFVWHFLANRMWRKYYTRNNNAALPQSATDATEQMMYEIENLETLAEDLTELADSINRNLKAFLL